VSAVCASLLNPACLAGQAIGAVAGAIAGQFTGDVLSGIASAVESAVAFIVSNNADWWVRIPSPDLAAEPAVARLQQWMLPVAAAVAVLGMTITGAKIALTRKASPLIDAGSGLVTIAATTAVGVLLPTLLLRAGDAWSDWVLNASTGGQFAARLTSVLIAGGGVQAPALVVVLGLIALIISALQAMLMLFRQGALVILAGLLPLAAAGTLTSATRPWFRKVTSWMLALICYKPAAAAVYATAFTLTGTGRDLRTVLMGLVMVFLSLLALPVLMRFFTWTTGTIADSASGGGFLQTALSGTAAIGALRGTGPSGGAAGQARMMAARLGPQPGQPAAAPAGGQPAGRPPSGAAPAGAGRATAMAAGRATAASPGAAAAAAGGPAGAAVTVLTTAASAARQATGRAMQPGDTGEGSR
jgi:hypothetical protein